LSRTLKTVRDDRLEKRLVNLILTPTKLHELLCSHFGELHWWPHDACYHKDCGSDPRFEIMVGAILTQNTAWSNVEKALLNLKAAHLLEINSLAKVNLGKLTAAIRPSGYYNQKAARLKELSSYLLENYNGDLDLFFSKETPELREELLSLKGIGPETADSMLLYAGAHPIFVVDSYTKRICSRIPITKKTCLDYSCIQNHFQLQLSAHYSDQTELVSIYNSLHAEIVELSKQFCTKTKPLCADCPLSLVCKKIIN